MMDATHTHQTVHPCPHCGHTPYAPVMRTVPAPLTLTDVVRRLVHLEELIEDLTLATDHCQYQIDQLTARLCATDHGGLGRGGWRAHR